MNFQSFFPIVKEFIRALGNRRTYSIRNNCYFIFGVLWGIPVPIVTSGMSLYHRNLSFSLSNIAGEFLAYPIQFFFLLHPLLFGIVFGAMGTVRDEKEKQRLDFQNSLVILNKELKEKNKSLQELDKLKDNFLTMVSHELWSPLTTVKGYVSLLKEKKLGELTQKQKDILAITEEQIEHLDRLIADLIDISEIEAGKLKIVPEYLDVNKMVEKTIASLSQRALEKNITLENRLSPQLPFIWADSRRITQVFTNILGNAIKFTPDNGKVSIDARVMADSIEFFIEDTGIGIFEAQLANIFEKFYQVDSAAKRRYGGCGLGLGIAKSIIELHQGRIWVESKVNAGSKFFFEIRKCPKTKMESKQDCLLSSLVSG